MPLRVAPLPLLVALLLAAPAAAQDPAPRDEATLTAAALEARIAELEASALDDASKATALASLRQAVDALRQADEWTAKATEFERLAAEAPEHLAAIRAELSRPPEAAAATSEPPPDATVVQLEQYLQQTEAELAAARAHADQLRSESGRRADRRTALTEAIAQLRQRLSETDEALKATPPAGEPLEVTQARRAALQAQRRALAAEARSDESELTSYDARAELLPARRDRAQRRVTSLEQRVAAAQERVATRRRLDVEQARREAIRLQREAALQTPKLAALADQNRALADQRGANDELEQTRQAIAEARSALATIRGRFQETRRRERAAGLTDAMGLILRRDYEDLPERSALQRKIRQTQDRLAKAELDGIRLEELRSRAGDIDGALAELLPADEPREPSLEAIARELLAAQRDYLDALIADNERLFGLLAELDLAQRRLAAGADEFRAYVEKRILWIPSVTSGALPSWRALADAVGWLTSGWGATLRAAHAHARDHLSDLVTPLLLLLAALSGWLWSRAVRRRPPPPSLEFTATVAKVGHAALRAAPLPCVLFGLGWFLARPTHQGTHGLAVAAGLRHAAWVVGVLALGWQLLRRGGLGADLRWPRAGLRHVRRHLAWFVPVKAVTAFVAVALARQPENAWSDALGRTAFCAGLIALGVFAQRVLRTDSPLLAGALARPARSWPFRLRPVWFPAVLLMPLVLLVLTLTGYYYTATRVEVCLEQTLVLVAALAVAHGLMIRWLLLARRRVARAHAGSGSGAVHPAPPLPPPAAEPASDARAEPAPEPSEPAPGEAPAAPPSGASSAAPPADGGPTDPSQTTPPPALGDDEADSLDLAAVRLQANRLFGTVIALGLLAGSYAIWYDVLPALRRLDQLQVWPSLAVVPLQEEAAFSVLEGAPLAAAEGEAPADAAAKAPPADAPAANAEPIAPVRRLTLADLGRALLLLILTILLTRNLPGLLELVLLERLPLDAGARYALIAVTRYVIVIVGSVAAAQALGIDWSSVQWLAAALTFGLAFGLQEIFANFISGLILLAERPIRVGDVVTVAGVNGKVARIRIRATTITQWNGKELVLPNKTFVTGEVVNWTLSTPTIRIEVPVGVAYGSDPTQVTEVLLAAARAHAGVLQEPEPAAFFLGFGASSLDFELRFWVASPNDIPPVRQDVLRSIATAFASEGIEIPFPQHDLHVRTGEALRLQVTEPGPGPIPPARPAEAPAED